MSDEPNREIQIALKSFDPEDDHHSLHRQLLASRYISAAVTGAYLPCNEQAIGIIDLDTGRQWEFRQVGYSGYFPECEPGDLVVKMPPSWKPRKNGADDDQRHDASRANR